MAELATDIKLLGLVGSSDCGTTWRANGPTREGRTQRVNKVNSGRFHRQSSSKFFSDNQLTIVTALDVGQAMMANIHSWQPMESGLAGGTSTVAPKLLHIQSVHLSRGVAGAGGGARRGEAINRIEIVCREHDVGGVQIFLEMPARLRARDRHNGDAGAGALRDRPGDGELRERGVLPARDLFEA